MHQGYSLVEQPNESGGAEILDRTPNLRHPDRSVPKRCIGFWDEAAKTVGVKGQHFEHTVIQMAQAADLISVCTISVFSLVLKI